MEHTFSYLIITTILFLISKGLLIISAIASIFFILFILYIYNNIDRKETLNIIRDNKKLYFYLSDDLLFSVKLTDQQSQSEIIRYSVNSEMSTLRDMVDNIDFINFRDDRLHRELNRLVQN